MMQKSIAAIALIPHPGDGEIHWLARWNAPLNCYAFLTVQKQKQNQESFCECLIREVAEVLGLEEGADFIIADNPHSHLQYTALSEGTRAETAYTFELYMLDLTGDFAQDKINSDEQNRWLRPAEIKSCTTADGQPVSQMTTLVMEMAGLLSDPADE